MPTLLLQLLAAATVLCTGPTHAAVIDFDDLNADATLTSMDDFNPYGGVDWNKWYLGDTAVDGYGNAAHSGSNYVMNGYGVDALEVSRPGGLNFNGAWFAAPAINGAQASWINISAYDLADQLIGTSGNIAIDATYRWVSAPFANAARIVVTRDDGFFAMDDVELSAPGKVPEPGSWSLLVAAALAMTTSRSRGLLQRSRDQLWPTGTSFFR